MKEKRRVHSSSTNVNHLQHVAGDGGGLTDTPISDVPPGAWAWQYTDMTDIHSTPPPLLPSLLQSTTICITLIMPRPPVEQCLHL